MIEFQTPQISAETVTDTRGTFTIEPLDRGFGYTFGNSLRRVLLSSLTGAAVTSVRIEGVAHEFSTIPGVTEDVTDIVLNLKDVVCRMHSDASEIEAPLVVTGPGEVTAGDIDLPSGVEILNPETHIATLEKKTKLEIGRRLDVAGGDDAGALLRDVHLDLRRLAVQPADQVLEVEDDVGHVLADARQRRELVRDALDLDGRDGGALERREEHAAQRVAERVAEAAVERLDRERTAVLLDGLGRDSGDLEIEHRGRS